MYPKFPQFVPLTLEDKATIQLLTHSLPPYSDFNFTSLWSWNVKGLVSYSILNGNLVICLTDYLTGLPSYSFCGDQNVHDTAVNLLEYLMAEELTPELKLIPEICAQGLRTSELDVKADQDNSDYILDIKKLTTYSGSELKPHRNLVTKFNKLHQAVIRQLELHQPDLQAELENFFHRWIAYKQLDQAATANELTAFKRVFHLAHDENILGLGLYVNNQLAGFTINEMLPHNYLMIHFEKGEAPAYPGIYQVLMQQTAQFFANKGYQFINYQQDLGLAGLKQNKSSFKPHHFLHKYKVCLKQA